MPLIDTSPVKHFKKRTLTQHLLQNNGMLPMVGPIRLDISQRTPSPLPRHWMVHLPRSNRPNPIMEIMALESSPLRLEYQTRPPPTRTLLHVTVPAHRSHELQLWHDLVVRHNFDRLSKCDTVFLPDGGLWLGGEIAGSLGLEGLS